MEDMFEQLKREVEEERRRLYIEEYGELPDFTKGL